MLWTGPVPDFFLYFNYLVPFYQSFGRVAKVRGSLAGVGGNKYLSSYSVSISFFLLHFYQSSRKLRGLGKGLDVTGICPVLYQYFSLSFAAFSSAFGRVAKVRGSLARVWR